MQQVNGAGFPHFSKSVTIVSAQRHKRARAHKPGVAVDDMGHRPGEQKEYFVIIVIVLGVSDAWQPILHANTIAGAIEYAGLMQSLHGHFLSYRQSSEIKPPAISLSNTLFLKGNNLKITAES
ncbi:hypothetical protein M989_01400 [Kluyvera georgiana ATCC 51603]|uniref:Uncharacterized protein n=1 Tax=Kluyvera georgiana ATCC 51603 TaxID=1354264 RepID=A0A1B7K3V8_9ENTR|nr:hypothetical protein M989_01400 [Kluyvera georgiana ATCC 51603]